MIEWLQWLYESIIAIPSAIWGFISQQFAVFAVWLASFLPNASPLMGQYADSLSVVSDRLVGGYELLGYFVCMPYLLSAVGLMMTVELAKLVINIYKIVKSLIPMA